VASRCRIHSKLCSPGLKSKIGLLYILFDSDATASSKLRS
jgi:hypothetical protein